ncbi:MAG: four-helix bundle copper-binding protein [Gemmatimonadaceae bacterium]
MLTAEHTISKEMQQCIDECLGCYSICVQTVQQCLKIGGKHAEANHIRLLNDCAEICRTSAGFMLRGSPLHSRTCAVCAEVCRACEQSCRSMGDDQMMQQCADACRSCAESCARMSKG